MVEREVTDMIFTLELERRLRLENGILMSTSWRGQFESYRRYSTKRLGNCAGGIVRPGVRTSGDQAVEEGGYSLTVAGRAALANLDTATILIAQPGSLAATLNGYRPLFGDGFHQRAMEAIKCRNAEAWLACCAMVGAAAESVLLTIAITKEKDEERVLRTYRGSRGRQAVLNMIVGQADAQRRNTLTTFAAIVSLWRDDAAHGQASPIDTSNADEALRQFLHMCQWVACEWDSLTA
jgi:hypothetical protein